MDQLNTLLQRGFPWMAFPSDLEAQFLQDGQRARLRHFLISGLISLGIFNGFLLVDYLMANDVFWIAVEMRLGVFTPISLIFLYIGWRYPDWLLRTFSPFLVESLVLITGLAAAANLVYILTITKGPYAHFYHIGLVVVVTYGNVVQRLRFWHAAVYSFFMVMMHLVGIFLLPDFPSRLLLPIVSAFVFTALFTLSANYMMERDERNRYLLTRRERGLIETLREAQARLTALSHIDSLTMIHNRRHFQEQLEQVWARAQHGQTPVCVLTVDVDHFKKYNDRYGHPAGDECLKAIAKVMQTHLRSPIDLVARYGGEEFIALLPSTELPVAVAVAERIREAVEALQVRHEGSDAALVLTISIGVACCRGDLARSTSALITASDAALYQAKRDGRNRVCALAVD